MNIDRWLKNIHGLRSNKATTRAPSIDFERKNGTNTWWVVFLWLLALPICTVVLSNWMQLEESEAKTVLVEEQFTKMALQQQKVMHASGHTSPLQKKQLDAFAQQNVTPYALLDTVGNAWNQDVAILRLEVNTLAQELDMEVESKVMADTFRFIDRLQTNTQFEVFLLQSSVNTKDPMHPTSFKLKIKTR